MTGEGGNSFLPCKTMVDQCLWSGQWYYRSCWSRGFGRRAESWAPVLLCLSTHPHPRQLTAQTPLPSTRPALCTPVCRLTSPMCLSGATSDLPLAAHRGMGSVGTDGHLAVADGRICLCAEVDHVRVLFTCWKTSRECGSAGCRCSAVSGSRGRQKTQTPRDDAVATKNAPAEEEIARRSSRRPSQQSCSSQPRGVCD